MQIPEFQPSLPPRQSERVAPLAPQSTAFSGFDGPSAVRSATGSDSIPILGFLDSVDTLDAVELSPLSRAILDGSEVDSRVESLERAYSLGNYSVNSEDLARTLVRTLVSNGDRREKQNLRPTQANEGARLGE